VVGHSIVARFKSLVFKMSRVLFLSSPLALKYNKYVGIMATKYTNMGLQPTVGTFSLLITYTLENIQYLIVLCVL